MDQESSRASSNIQRTRCGIYKPSVANILEPLDTFANKYVRKKDINYSIKKLYELTSDSVTQDNKLWIHRLLQQFLQSAGNSGYKIKHLPAVMQVLEFLALKSQDTPEYKKHLNIMLDLCAYPPLLEKSSDHLVCFETLVHYFTLLGYLLVLLPNNQDILKVLKAIQELLVRQTPVEISAIKLNFLHKAVEKSRLPLILTDLIEISSLGIFKNIMDVTFTIGSISNTCCHRMLDAGILNYLLFRFAELTSIHELNEELLRTPIYDKIIVLTNILWLLIKSILPPQPFPSNLKNMQQPDSSAMRSLRNIFQSAISNSKHNKQFLLIRNDLAAIILGGIVALPLWHLVSCGIAEDIITAAVNTIESNEIQFDNDNHFIFEKTILSILCYFSDSGGLISIMKDNNIIEKLISRLNYEDVDTKIMKKIYHFSYLMPYRLQTLAVLTSKMPDEFVKYRGFTKLLTIFNECTITEPLNTRDTLEIVKAICTIVINKYSILLSDFHEAGAIPIIFKFIEITSMFNQYSTQYQRILTLLIIIMEYTMVNNLKVIQCYENQTINILITIMKKCQCDEKNNFPIDERLLIAIGSYIGECIVWHQTTTTKFIGANGIYIMLDLIENSSLFVRNVYFKVLVDLCTNFQCMTYVCTWRGSNKKKGFMSLLARSWREEEFNWNVKRTREGCIEDVELPLTGQIPKYSNGHSKINHEFSPTIVSMIGSIRPKIYSLRKIMLVNCELCDESKKHYKILVEDLPMEDAITFCIIDQFFRFTQGQVWLEVFNYLEQCGINPLGTDGQLLLVMTQRYRRCAVYVQDRQEKILKDAKRKELIEEQKEFIRIRDATLSSALTAVKEMDYIRRTTDESYRLKKKKEQISQVNKALNFPCYAIAEHCHRTFNEDWSVTPIIGQHHTVKNNFLILEQKTDTPPPVSPSSDIDVDFNNLII